jgi:hypothetical protein
MKPEEAIARSEAMAQSAGGSYKALLKREYQTLGFPLDQRGLDAISDTPPVKGGGATVPHTQDSEAVKWAKQNPKDPRAVKILKLNGL